MNGRPLRILFLADGVSQDLPGGGRVVAQALALGLTGRGHEVTLLVPRLKPGMPDEEQAAEGRIVRYQGTGQGWGFVRAGRAACARLWAEKPFDIVHTHFAYAALGPLQAVPRAVPRVRTFHGPWDEEAWFEDGGDGLRGLPRFKALLRRRLRFGIERQSLRSSARVVTLSRAFRAQVTGRFRIPGARVATIPGGADLARFLPAEDRGAVRRALGLPPDRRLLLSIRRLAARMGLDSLITAMPAVVERHPDVLLLIGGRGPERERLERCIREWRLEEHVTLLGFIPDDALAAHYQAADVFVLPTVALEGFGLVTAEALACGTPVIGTPVGATPEILAPLDARLVADAATPDALARSIVAFLDGDWAQDLGAERLRRYACENFTWDRHVAAVEALYAALLATK